MALDKYSSILSLYFPDKEFDENGKIISKSNFTKEGERPPI